MSQSQLCYGFAGLTRFYDGLRLDSTIKVEVYVGGLIRRSMHAKENPAANLAIRVYVSLHCLIDRK